MKNIIAPIVLITVLILFFGKALQAETAAGWIKCPQNPVLGGKLGVCFDISMLQKKDGTYQMFFSWRTKKSIALTESKDGIHWSEPIIILSPAGGWEENLNRPSVLLIGDKYHLWYTGQAKGRSKIGYAISADGIHWTRVKKDPVLVSQDPWENVAVMCPHVLWDENRKIFRLWYSAGEQYEPNAIGYAESKNGIDWKRYQANPIFKADPNTTWEKHKVTAAQILWHKGWFYMFYIGFENEHLARIGIARSKDGVSNWNRLSANPVIGPDKNAWDADACYKPFVIFSPKEGKYRLWYNGRTGSVEQIGMAVHDGEELGFDLPADSAKPAVLDPEKFRSYIDRFNKDDEETVIQAWPNSVAWTFLSKNMPLLDYPDKEIETTWYFRWWTFRKHIKKTQTGGYVITEFLPDVSWAGKENAISCPAAHHFREGRWLHHQNIFDEYAKFWLRGGGALRSYSFWPADSILRQAAVTGKTESAVELLPELIENYRQWEKSKLDPNGLFWQIDDRDGMEKSIGGSGYRATINTYMFMEASALAKIAKLANEKQSGKMIKSPQSALNYSAIEKEYSAKADKIKNLVNAKLWDKKARFYKVAPRVKNSSDPLELQNVREEHGFTPWYADALIPPPEYNIAWRQLTDPQGFFAPFGPTTAEQRHPGFKVVYQGHECQWNGPSWPYSTSITLTALANLINRESGEGRNINDLKEAYLKTLKIYTRSHHRTLKEGRIVSWIDENINPMTGDWISRSILEANGWKKKLGGYERGKDYNHSTYCDLIVTGLIGLRPRLDNSIGIFPLTESSISYFCLDNVLYHNRILTVLYDTSGERYQKGKGFRVLVDGKTVYQSNKLPEQPVVIKL